jgi:hypothetical protein
MHLTKVFIDVQYSIPRDGVVHRDGNRYKPTGFSLLRPIPMKEPPPPPPSGNPFSVVERDFTTNSNPSG